MFQKYYNSNRFDHSWLFTFNYKIHLKYAHCDINSEVLVHFLHTVITMYLSVFQIIKFRSQSVQIILQFHTKYKFKSRSDNAPHIFAVADRAYQDMLHHKEPQHILLAGETLSGKTTNMLHLLQHLLCLGQVTAHCRLR